MRSRSRGPLTRFLAVACLAAAGAARSEVDPLASWMDAAAKKTILAFVGDVTKPGGPRFVPAAERIAVFDNDGTLWAEQPMTVQLAFVLDRVKALAPKHPEWTAIQDAWGTAIQKVFNGTPADQALMAAQDGLLKTLVSPTLTQ